MVAYALALSAAAYRRRSMATMQVGMTGGDLEGGRDAARNAEVAALKKLFYQEEQAQPDERAVIKAAIHAHVGLHANLPVARFRMVLMPHQQQAFNIFQPALVHLFESLLATPRPWLFATAQLPGGVDNLGNPEFALPGLGGESGDEEAPGPSATLQGTLSEVIMARRMTDARLYLVVHCLRRGIILRGTQALPFTRADVLCLPDAEQLGAAARSVLRREPPGEPDGDGFAAAESSGNGCTAAESGGDAKALQQAAILAAAAAEDRCWQPYEFAPLGRGGGREFAPGAAAVPAFASFAPLAAGECARGATEAAQGARSAADSVAQTEAVSMENMAAMLEAARAAEAAKAAGAAEAAVEAVRAVGCSAIAQAALAKAEVETVAAAAQVEAEEAQTLAALEQQVWMQLDAFLRALATRKDGALPVPAQLLSLLPPPPAEGWPEGFVLHRVALALEEQAAAAAATAAAAAAAAPGASAHAEGDDPSRAESPPDLEPFVPCDHTLYPARRRAQRLSNSIWLLIGDESADLQPALEARSTSERMRLALERIREMRAAI